MDWRIVLGRRLVVLTFGLNVVGTLVATSMQTGAGRLPMGMSGAVAGIALGWALRRGVAMETRAWILVGGFCLLGLVGHATIGFLAGPAGALLLAVLITGLLLGRRPMAYLIAFLALAMLAIGTAMVSGYLPPPSAADTSPSRTRRAWSVEDRHTSSPRTTVAP